MPICPTCFTKYPDGTRDCTSDGTALVPDATFAHVDRDIPAGTTVGEYTIESKLGEGGFGAVYRAVHPLIGKRAAVKILSREFSSNPQMVSRFIAEARAVNQIRHRNIIDIFSFGQLPDGRQYYIMELLEGLTFDAYLSNKKRLDLAEALPVLRGIARALDAAHAKGILHRDLKPENVFLVRHDDGTFEPKLLDFGLVKLIDAKTKDTTGPTAPSGGSSGHNTKTGTPMGTPYYMSPEQCRGLDVDTRTDVYSFGVMVFEILTGDLPFRGSSTLDILVQHMSSPPPSASERCAAVPASLDGPLAQIMAKDPNGRPSTVGEACEFLARAAGMPADSQRRFQLDSTGMSAAERAVAPTVMLDSSVPPTPSSPATAAPAPAPAQTFLGGASVPSTAPPKKSRVPIVVAAAVALAVGAISVFAVGLQRHRSEDRTPAAPLPSEVDLRIDGLPEGTSVAIDGTERGTSGGPYKVTRNKEVEIRLSASGHETKELVALPGSDMVLTVSLAKAPAVAIPEPAPDAGAVATHAGTSVKPSAPAPAPAPAPAGKPTGSKLHKDLDPF